MINHFYYNEQIKSWIRQFSAIFSGIHVKYGKNQDRESDEFQRVPVNYGSIDRVVAAIKAGNTQNKPLAVPAMSTYLLGIELAPERRKGVGVEKNMTTMQPGGLYPNDLKVATIHQPIPYNLTMELAIYTSNTDQMLQIMEQILMLFDPTLQIQKGTEALDYAKISSVELVSVNNDENFPMLAERRMMMWTLNFNLPIWISPPAGIQNNYVERVMLRYGDLDKFSLGEYDENGELVTFGEDALFGETEITG